MFAAVLDPADRVVNLQRQCRQDDFLGIEASLRPEPATDIGSHDAETALLNIEQISERDAYCVRRLGRGIKRDLVEAVVAISQYPAAFKRRARLPLHAKFSGDDDFSGARC